MTTGYFERIEKRSPYERNDKAAYRWDEREKTGSVFTFFMLLFLVTLLPVGLIMLWSRKARWKVGTKLLIMLVSIFVFSVLFLYMSEMPTQNETLLKIQAKMTEFTEFVYDKTEYAFGAVSDWTGKAGSGIVSKANYVWNGVKISFAKFGVAALGGAAENASYIKHDLPVLLLERYKYLTNYTQKQNSDGLIENIKPAANASAGNGGSDPANPAGQTLLGLQRTPNPNATPVPTPGPTPTPKPAPTPTPVPVQLPYIKNVADAPVYFTPGGTYYHLVNYCSGMMNAQSHTLKEAAEAGKKVCEVCGVVSLALLDRTDEDYMWLDGKNVAHTTDICKDFYPGRYRVMPFEDVYNGTYTYCETCQADLCYEYMKQHDVSYMEYDALDPETRMLYDYEKSITVYYWDSSKNYHSDPDCQQMYEDECVHTLYDALHTDKLLPCPACDPYNENDAWEKLQEISGS